jgi:ABC-type histidine transport system ATPase subunit
MIFMGNGVVVEEGKPSELVARPSTPELQTFLSHFHGSG